VLAAVPVSPGGAGVVEWAYLTTLSGFGVPAVAVSLGVVAYRGAQALLPTIVGGVCYVSLVRGPWAVTAPGAGAGGDRADELVTTGVRDARLDAVPHSGRTGYSGGPPSAAPAARPASGRRGACAYCLAMATRRRSSGSMKWSWSSSPTSSWTQLMRPVNRLLRAS
jgi:hypothetical protein